MGKTNAKSYKRATISVTTLEAYHSCPWAFNRSQQIGLRITNPGMRFGLVVHDLGHDYSKHCRADGLGCDRPWIEAEAVKRKVLVDPADRGELVDSAVNIAECAPGHTGAELSETAIYFKIVNGAFVVCDRDDPECVVSMRLDRGWQDDDGTIDVLDYKTNRNIPARDEMGPWFRQPIVYMGGLMLAAEQGRFRFGVEPTRWRPQIFFTRYAAMRRAEPMSADDLRAAMDEFLADCLAFLQDRRNEPRPGDGCVYCPFAGDGCPAYKGHRPITNLRSPEDALEALGQLHVAQAIATQLDAALRTWAEQAAGGRDGTVPLPDGSQIGWTPRKRRAWPDAQKAVEYLLQLDVPREVIWSVLSPLSKTRLEAIVNKAFPAPRGKAGEKGRRKRAAALEVMDKLADRWTETRWSVSDATEGDDE